MRSPQRALLVVEANKANLSARTLAEAIGEAEGILFAWILQGKAEDAEQSHDWTIRSAPDAS